MWADYPPGYDQRIISLRFTAICDIQKTISIDTAHNQIIIMRGFTMISKQAVSSLNLKLYTKNGCHDLFHDINTNYKSLTELESDLKSRHDDPETLNKLWWVLNYHSEMLDQSRKLRAIVETKLDSLAHTSGF